MALGVPLVISDTKIDQFYFDESLVKFFKSIGMQWGADANAHTGFYETVYDVLLAKGDREHLEKGLTVLLDYAQGAFLLESEIERERRVVLAEKPSSLRRNPNCSLVSGMMSP